MEKHGKAWKNGTVAKIQPHLAHWPANPLATPPGTCTTSHKAIQSQEVPRQSVKASEALSVLPAPALPALPALPSLDPDSCFVLSSQQFLLRQLFKLGDAHLIGLICTDPHSEVKLPNGFHGQPCRMITIKTKRNKIKQKKQT